MPLALSLDLRSRIVSVCQTAELTQGEIADLFQVHLKTVEKLWQHFRRTGSAQTKSHGGGVRARLAGHEEDLRRLVAEQSDHTLAEYVALLWERHQVVTSVPVLSRTLKVITPWPSMWRYCGNAIRWSPACPCSRVRSKRWVCRRKKVTHGGGTKPPGNGAGAAEFPDQTEPGAATGSGLCR